MSSIKSNYHWSNGDKQLIEKVKQYPSLYKNTAKSRWLTEENYEIWDDISKELGWSASKCKQRWTRIKSAYMQRKHLGQRNSKFMDGTLSFIDLAAKTLKKASTTSNLPKSTLKSPTLIEPINIENVTTNKPNSSFVDQDMVNAVLESKKKIGDSESTTDEAIYRSISQLLSKSSFQPFLDQSKIDSEQHENRLISLPSSSNKTLETSNIRENIYDNMFEIEDASPILNIVDSLIVTKQMDDNNIKNLNDSSNLELTIMTNLAKTNRDPSDMKTFFRSISEYSIAKLSLDEQKDLRLKIHALMCKEELDFWTENIKEEDLDF